MKNRNRQIFVEDLSANDRDWRIVADDDQVLPVGDHLKTAPSDLKLKPFPTNLVIHIFDLASYDPAGLHRFRRENLPEPIFTTWSGWALRNVHVGNLENFILKFC